MFKRVLVLVVFLFGVFWWLTSRDNTPDENVSEVVTVETETGSDETETDTDTDTEPESETESDEDEAGDTETVAESADTKTASETESSDADSANVTTDTSSTASGTTDDTTTNNDSGTSVEVSTDTTVSTPDTAPVPEPVVNNPAPTPVQPTPVTPSIPDRITDVTVYVYEWGLDLSNKSIPAGTVNFQVQNDGRFTHDFSVSEFGNLGKVTPSETKTFTIKLAAGDYEAFSQRRQDYERGVVETFSVVQ